MRVEKIVYKGVEYRRYPDSKSPTQRRYFTCGTGRAERRLHRQVWIDHFGAIPAGCHVHHKDCDITNNDIKNLECMPSSKHCRSHDSTPALRARRAEILVSVRDKAAAWHRSAAGRRWHREHAAKVIARIRKRKLFKRCKQCGRSYRVLFNKVKDAFCSRNCKAAARRKSRVDNESRVCLQCGKTFAVNRYSKTRCCGGPCAGRYRWAQRRAGL
jgi:hypothetical protein